MLDTAPHPLGAGAPGEISPGDRAAPGPSARAAGSGSLAFARVDGATALVHCAARTPLQILVPRRRGASAWAFLASHGGGLVAGDRIDVDVEVGAGAAALLATQAETKVYRADRRGAAWQRIAARVAAGGVLVFLPDPVSPFAGARYVQHLRFDLAEGASLVAVDALVAGRCARGERWSFASVSSRFDVAVGRRLALADGLALSPSRGGELAARLGRFEAFATAVVVGPLFAEGSRVLLADVAARPVERGAALLASASPLADGLLLRLAAATAEDLAGFLRKALAFAAGPLGDDPFGRRW